MTIFVFIIKFESKYVTAVIDIVKFSTTNNKNKVVAH